MKTKSVKGIGNDTEQLLLDKLQVKGYWAHLFADNYNGQPCDIIALKGDRALLMDAKHCDSGVFYYSRVEANQVGSFSYATQCGVSPKNLGFALYLASENQFYWLSWELFSVSSQKVLVKALPLLDKVL